MINTSVTLVRLTHLGLLFNKQYCVGYFIHCRARITVVNDELMSTKYKLNIKKKPQQPRYLFQVELSFSKTNANIRSLLVQRSALPNYRKSLYFKNDASNVCGAA